MSRGATLSAYFTPDFSTNNDAPKRNGRSPLLDAQRTECLLHRFYFIGRESGYSIEFMVRFIARDFWITERRVLDILQANGSRLKEIRKMQITKKMMESRWPMYSWEVPDIKQLASCNS